MITLMIILFVIGYAAIAFEHPIKINKSASALLTGVLCWTVYIMMGEDKHIISEQLTEHLGELSGILFFLMGAMTIVELIDAHDGFDVITSRIKTTDKRKLLWIICLITFFLSAVLDNLTTAIVMVSLLRKLIDKKEDRLLFIGMVVIAANAGGAWSPIGDVTTTMLWIGGQVTAQNIMLKLFIPSIVCLIVPLLILSIKLKGKVSRPEITETAIVNPTSQFERNVVFFLGIGALVFVPVFKTITHLPPFMGVLFGLGILWVVTEIIHSQKDDEDKDTLSVVHALRKIDVPSILFFLGILIAISSLQATGILASLAHYMNDTIGDLNIIVPAIGLLSAIVDNVPLVAASIGMYDLAAYPTDSYLWEFLAYCAGTGGSILIIGSAAGVAAMGMEKIDFIWYLKKIAWLAVLGYAAGAICYIGLEYFFHL
ncbi:MAG: sodium:proton antiporter [Bacteroidetes bacterium RIFCSPLOWO2_12_FULL_35_15]|nr:MAG: sodium:proton antiporter [Bacteroidetes bacterium RIFCSPLOWO2_12_FULL_35_15]